MSSEPKHRSENSIGSEAGVSLFTDVEATLVSMQDIVGRKWQPVIVYHLLADGPLGFSALKDRVDGISSKMLSDSLDDLETQGLVTRTILSDKPVRVEYALTDRGRALEPVISNMLEWGTEHGTASDSHDGNEARGARTTSGARGEER